MQEVTTHYKNSTDRNIEVIRLLRALWKWKYLILAVTLIAGIIGFVCSEAFIPPTYRSYFTAYVNNRMGTTENINITSSSDLSASQNLAYVYQNIIISRSVLMDAAERCGKNYTYQDMRKMVTPAVSSGTALITVYVQAESPEAATALSTAISQTAPEHVARVVDGSSMRILDDPTIPTTPYGPDSWNNALMCIVIALTVSVVSVILLDLIVDKVYSVKEMEERYGIVVVGFIPDLNQAEKYQKYYNRDRNGRNRK